MTSVLSNSSNRLVDIPTESAEDRFICDLIWKQIELTTTGLPQGEEVRIEMRDLTDI